MKRYQKIIQLGVLLLGMISCIMGLQTTVEASEKELGYFTMEGLNYGNDKAIVIVEKGVEDFYIPEYCYANWKDKKWMELYMETYEKWTLDLYVGMPEMSYQSSNEAVASIEPSGRVVAKEAGRTTISATLYGKTDSVQLEVIDDMEVYADEIYRDEYSRKAYAGIEKAIREFLAIYQEGEILTFKNPKRAYQLANKMKQIQNLKYKCYLESMVNLTGEDETRLLAYPIIQHYRSSVVYGSNIYEQITDEALFEGKKNLIKSVSGKGRTVTITLKKTVTEKMIFGSQWKYLDSTIKRTNCLKIPAYVIDNKTGHSYEAEAVIKKGSKKIIFRTKKLNMQKGRSYTVDILQYDYSSYGNEYWLKTKGKFKAK